MLTTPLDHWSARESLAESLATPSSQPSVGSRSERAENGRVGGAHCWDQSPRFSSGSSFRLRVVRTKGWSLASRQVCSSTQLVWLDSTRIGAVRLVATFVIRHSSS